MNFRLWIVLLLGKMRFLISNYKVACEQLIIYTSYYYRISTASICNKQMDFTFFSPKFGSDSLVTESFYGFLSIF